MSNARIQRSKLIENEDVGVGSFGTVTKCEYIPTGPNDPNLKFCTCEKFIEEGQVKFQFYTIIKRALPDNKFFADELGWTNDVMTRQKERGYSDDSHVNRVTGAEIVNETGKVLETVIMTKPECYETRIGVESKSVDDYLQLMRANTTNPFINTMTLQLMNDAYRGLDELHAIRIIHNDFANRNIFVSGILTRDGVPIKYCARVGDFGLSRALKGKTEQFVITDYDIGPVAIMTTNRGEHKASCLHDDIYSYHLSLLNAFNLADPSIYDVEIYMTAKMNGESNALKTFIGTNTTTNSPHIIAFFNRDKQTGSESYFHHYQLQQYHSSRHHPGEADITNALIDDKVRLLKAHDRYFIEVMNQLMIKALDSNEAIKEVLTHLNMLMALPVSVAFSKSESYHSCIQLMDHHLSDAYITTNKSTIIQDIEQLEECFIADKLKLQALVVTAPPVSYCYFETPEGKEKLDKPQILITDFSQNENAIFHNIKQPPPDTLQTPIKNWSEVSDYRKKHLRLQLRWLRDLLTTTVKTGLFSTKPIDSSTKPTVAKLKALADYLLVNAIPSDKISSEITSSASIEKTIIDTLNAVIVEAANKQSGKKFTKSHVLINIVEAFSKNQIPEPIKSKLVIDKIPANYFPKKTLDEHVGFDQSKY